MRLSLATLGQLGPKVSVPKYQRQSLSPGIVHLGVGNFHRAHQQVYLDSLFNKGRDLDWAVIGGGVQPADAAMRTALAQQDYLTTVVAQEATLSTAQVTGVMLDFVDPSDKAGLLKRLADPAIRIVSLTVTEGGYFIDPATGQFNPADPRIAADGAAPHDPATVFGLIAAGLAARKKAGTPPFTVMSCDNIPHNGAVARSAVAGVARLSDPGLASWIEDTCAFPNAMVDRITPATTDNQRAALAKDFGVTDLWPVFCEEFIQWVLEDDFCNGRPAFEEAGATFVKDVTPYEFMKIRILNGGHAVIAYAGSLLDVHFVHDAMAHPLIGAFLAKIEREEIIPTVPPVPDTNISDYHQLIERRFSNPKIGDTIPRLCFDGSSRQPKFIVPVIRDRLKQGRGIAGLALESALWCRHCAGITASGKTIPANDPMWSRLQATALAAKADPQAWLAMRDIYGDVGAAAEMRAAFSASLHSLWQNGVDASLRDYLGMN